MAKMFYTQDEALAKLGCKEEKLKKAVRDAKLREFRDAGKINYKVDEVDKLAASGELGSAKDDSLGGVISLGDDNPAPDLSSSGSIGLAGTGAGLGGSAAGGSAAGPSSSGSGGLSLDSLDASGIDLAAGSIGGDMVSLEEDDLDASSAGKTASAKKDDTVVSSVGVSVFDEEDLDKDADPMAKTILSGSGSGGIGLEGVGSGSGLLDLTRESDDTSLGAEFLEEIYPAEEGAEGAGTLEMGDDTRAGLEMDISEEEAAEQSDVLPATAAAEPTTRETASAPVAAATVSIDPFAQSASGLFAVALAAMCLAGLAIAAMIRDTWPSILDFVYAKLWMFGAGAVLVAGVVMVVSVFLGKRSQA
jgi:hypothetical protein